MEELLLYSNNAMAKSPAHPAEARSLMTFATAAFPEAEAVAEAEVVADPEVALADALPEDAVREAVDDDEVLG